MINKTVLNITIGVFLILALLVVIVRFFSGDEDTWICDNGQWVKHGNPSAPMPDAGCGAATNEEKTQFSVYFAKSNADIQDCSLVYPLLREVPKTLAVGQASLEELFKGPTVEEKRGGHTSFFSDATKGILKKIKIIDKVVYVDLIDIRSIIPNASSSCGSSQLLAEMTNTLKQFSSVEKAIFAIDGSPRIFYEWLQIGCGLENNNCDIKPFE